MLPLTRDESREFIHDRRNRLHVLLFRTSSARELAEHVREGARLIKEQARRTRESPERARRSQLEHEQQRPVRDSGERPRAL